MGLRSPPITPDDAVCVTTLNDAIDGRLPRVAAYGWGC